MPFQPLILTLQLLAATAPLMQVPTLEASGVRAIQALPQGPRQDALALWQDQYDAARRHRDHGRTATLAGLALAVSGLYVTAHSYSCSSYSYSYPYSYRSCGAAARAIGQALIWGGLGTEVWGRIVWKEGDHEMTRLIMLRAGLKPDVGRALFPKGEFALEYRLRW